MINSNLIIQGAEAIEPKKEKYDVPFMTILPGADKLKLSRSAASLLGINPGDKTRVAVVRDYVTPNYTVIGTSSDDSIRTSRDGTYAVAVVSGNTLVVRSRAYCNILISRFNIDLNSISEEGIDLFLNVDEFNGAYLITDTKPLVDDGSGTSVKQLDETQASMLDKISNQ